MVAQQWYYKTPKGRFGPVSGGEIKKLAASGEIGPDDMLRCTDKPEWVPASKVKGLFPGATTPTDAQTLSGIANPTPKPVTASSVKNPSGVAKPTQAAKPQTPASAKPDVATKTLADTADPFASMGFDSTGLPSLDHLVALERQSKIIYREPPPEPVEDPKNKSKTKPKSAGKGRQDEEDDGVERGSATKIGMLAVPFGIMLCLGVVCGVIYAAMHMYCSAHLMSLVFAVGFSFVITSGLTKMLGLFAGNMLLKSKVKNEALALGYGGLIGAFGLYVFLAGYAWMLINGNPIPRSYKASPDQPARIAREKVPADPAAPNENAMIEGENEEELSPEEKAAEAEAAAEWKRKQEKEGGERIELNLFQEDKDPFEAMDEFKAKINAKQEAEMRKDVGPLANYAGDSLSLFGAFSPAWVWLSLTIFSAVSLVFWLIHGAILVLGTAHATWTSNLGYDPTKGGL